MKNDTPVVGMGVTHILHSDRNAWTVIKVISPKRIVIQRDRSFRVDKNGMSDNQSWEFEPDEQGMTRVITLRSDGRWREAGSTKGSTKGSTTYLVGSRDEFYDYTR